MEVWCHSMKKYFAPFLASLVSILTFINGQFTLAISFAQGQRYWFIFHYFPSSRNDICQLAVGHLAIRERNFGLSIQWKWLWTVLRVFFSIIICSLKMLSFRYSNKRQLHFQNLYLSTPLSFISNRTAFTELRISHKIPQVYLQTEFPTSDWLNIFHFYEIVDEFQFTEKRTCF